MSKSTSESSTTQSTSTTTQNYDQRVGADQGAIAIGAGGALTFSQQFGPDVAAAFDRLVTLAEGAGDLVLKVTQQANDIAAKALASGEAASKSTETALNTVTEKLSQTQQGNTGIFQGLFPFIAAAIIGIVAIFAFLKK